MKITKVTIENFRGIEHLELDFTDQDGKPLDLVVFAGPNGCGKTRILEGCQAAGGEVTYPETTSIGKITLEGELKGTRISQYYDASVPNVRKKTQKTLKSRTESRFEAKHRQPLPPFLTGAEYFSSWRWPELPGPVSVDVAGEKPSKPPSLERDRLKLIKKEVIGRIADRAFRSSAKIHDLLELVNPVWNQVYPEKKGNFVGDRIYSKNGHRYDVFFEDFDSKKTFSIDQLSSGEQEFFTLFAWLAWKSSEIQIFFIDEPELHLHPAWQRTILKVIRELLPDAQIIAATHSPQVLGEVPAESVYLLKNEDGKITVSHPDVTFGLDSDRILEDFMGASSRDEKVETMLRDLFREIDRDKLPEAREKLAELAQILKDADPELVKAETMIRRKEILGR